LCTGLAGIVVPVLPTTPFLLLAALLYMRGSQRFYDALLGNRMVGRYIRSYLEGRGMSPRMKTWTLLWLWTMMAATAMLATDRLTVRIILAIIGAGVTVHVLLIKNAERDANNHSTS